MVWGTPDMRDFLPEMSRVVKHGGYIISAVHETSKAYSPYVYVTGQYNHHPDHRFIPKEELDQLGLERIIVPPKLIAYEELSRWISKEGQEMSDDYVFEVFRKS